MIAGIGAVTGMVFLWKSSFGHYRAEHFLGPMWLIDDIALAAAAWGLWRVHRRGGAHPRWIWGVAGAGLLLLGSGILAQLCGGFGLSKALFYFVQVLWLGGLGLFLWAAWRGRFGAGGEPVSRSRLVLAAAAVRVGGSLLLLALFGSLDDPRMAYWSGLLCDWPSKLLFYYAFLTSRLEV